MRGDLCLIFWNFFYLVKWWTLTGSNCSPQHCQRCALPTELRAHILRTLNLKKKEDSFKLF